MKPAVLDSYAVICYLEQEDGAAEISELFSQCVTDDKPAFFCVVNWGEVLYHAYRVGGEITAQRIENAMRSLPLVMVDVDQELTRIAAKIKAHNKMSYADCFAAALAVRKRAELYTGDPEFAQVEKEVHIKWLSRKHGK